MTIANTANPTDPAIVAYSDATPTTAKSSYTDAAALAEPGVSLQARPADALRGLRDHDATGAEPAGADAHRQLAQPRLRGRLLRQRGPQADPLLRGGPHARVVLPADSRRSPFRSSASTSRTSSPPKSENNVDLGVQGYFNGSTTPVPVLYTVYRAGQRRQGLRRGHRDRHTAPACANGFGVHAQYTHTWTRAWVDGDVRGRARADLPDERLRGRCSTRRAR